MHEHKKLIDNVRTIMRSNDPDGTQMVGMVIDSWIDLYSLDCLLDAYKDYGITYEIKGDLLLSNFDGVQFRTLLPAGGQYENPQTD